MIFEFIKKNSAISLLIFVALSCALCADDSLDRELSTSDIEGICSQFENTISLENKGYLYHPGYANDVCAEIYGPNGEDFTNCILNKGNHIDIASLYANGEGVKQDFEKAISYVCQYRTNPTELKSMVSTLFKASKEGHLRKKFDYCNHVISSQNIAVCFDRKQHRVFQSLDDKFNEISATFSAKQKEAYDLLLKVANQFFDARAMSEQDLTGSLRSIFITEWRRDQKKWFLEILESLEAGKLKIEKADYPYINAKMQENYKKLERKFTESENQGYSFHRIFEKGSIESTQEDFLEFREAFANFVHIRYPTISIENAKSWLTENRIQQIKELN